MHPGKKTITHDLITFAEAFEALLADEGIQLYGVLTKGLEIRVLDESVWDNTPGYNIEVEAVDNFGASDLKPFRVYKNLSPNVRIYMNALHYGHKPQQEQKEAA